MDRLKLRGGWRGGNPAHGCCIFDILMYRNEEEKTQDWFTTHIWLDFHMKVSKCIPIYMHCLVKYCWAISLKVSCFQYDVQHGVCVYKEYVLVLNGCNCKLGFVN